MAHLLGCRPYPNAWWDLNVHSDIVPEELNEVSIQESLLIPFCTLYLTWATQQGVAVEIRGTRRGTPGVAIVHNYNQL